MYASKSMIIAMALVKGHLSVEEAARAAQVEVMSQIQNWGEVEDSRLHLSMQGHAAKQSSSS